MNIKKDQLGDNTLHHSEGKEIKPRSVEDLSAFELSNIQDIKKNQTTGDIRIKLQESERESADIGLKVKSTTRKTSKLKKTKVVHRNVRPYKKTGTEDKDIKEPIIIEITEADTVCDLEEVPKGHIHKEEMFTAREIDVGHNNLNGSSMIESEHTYINETDSDLKEKRSESFNQHKGIKNPGEKRSNDVIGERKMDTGSYICKEDPGEIGHNSDTEHIPEEKTNMNNDSYKPKIPKFRKKMKQAKKNKSKSCDYDTGEKNSERQVFCESFQRGILIKEDSRCVKNVINEGGECFKLGHTSEEQTGIRKKDYSCNRNFNNNDDHYFDPKNTHRRKIKKKKKDKNSHFQNKEAETEIKDMNMQISGNYCKEAKYGDRNFEKVISDESEVEFNVIFDNEFRGRARKKKKDRASYRDENNNNCNELGQTVEVDHKSSKSKSTMATDDRIFSQNMHKHKKKKMKTDDIHDIDFKNRMKHEDESVVERDLTKDENLHGVVGLNLLFGNEPPGYTEKKEDGACDSDLNRSDVNEYGQNVKKEKGLHTIRKHKKKKKKAKAEKIDNSDGETEMKCVNVPVSSKASENVIAEEICPEITNPYFSKKKKKRKRRRRQQVKENKHDGTDRTNIQEEESSPFCNEKTNRHTESFLDTDKDKADQRKDVFDSEHWTECEIENKNDIDMEEISSTTPNKQTGNQYMDSISDINMDLEDKKDLGFDSKHGNECEIENNEDFELKEESDAFSNEQIGKKHEDIEMESHIDTNPKRSVESEYKFEITPEIWQKIQPTSKTYGGKGRITRRMSGNWTHIFAENICSSHPGCVLVFKRHHVKLQASKKIGTSFMSAKAECKGVYCSGIFKFEIKKEPFQNEVVTVNYNVTGVVLHDHNEVNRRNISGEHRAAVGEKIMQSSAASVYYDNILSANCEQLDLGNFTSVPNQEVLRKIVSEVVHKEYMHSNVISELEILKESYNTEQYIHDIGLNPFTLIMFTKKQISLVKKLSSHNTLDIYIDSTGSIIHNLAGQKRPYLYSIVVKPEDNLPPVSLADMISTQHTIPRIELFLGTFRRAVSQEGVRLHIRKIETDYSLALIQACLRQFTNTTLKTYVLKCYDICTEKTFTDDFTCLHICSSHIFNGFIRSLKNAHVPKKRQTRLIILRAFAAFQNASTLPEAKCIYENICRVFLSPNNSPQVFQSKESLNKKQLVFDDEVIDLPEDTDIKIEEADVETLSIKEASPFTQFFQNVKHSVIESIPEKKKSDPNDCYSPELVNMIEDKFLAIFPLWSGVILNFAYRNQDFTLTRDTNVPVENWFKFLKEDKKMKRMRPARFVVNLKSAVESRLIEQSYPGARKPKTKKKNITSVDAKLDTREEIWKKRPRSTKPKYHPPNKKIKVEDKLPLVMTWGGKEQGIHLSNTCSIDNGLTIIHMFYLENMSFRQVLQNSTAKVYTTLASVMKLMDEKEFNAAKLVWVNFIEHEVGKVTDLHGDEYDYIFKHLSQEMRSTITSCCDRENCQQHRTQPTEERGGITVGTSETFNSLQFLIDKWVDDIIPCQSIGPAQPDMESHTCQGNQRVTRTVIPAPIVVIRVYEHCLYNRITTEEILKTREIVLKRKRYCLAGITLHRVDHYCAIVIYNKKSYWYDGLAGMLSVLPKDIDTWFPSHAVYCTS